MSQAHNLGRTFWERLGQIQQQDALWMGSPKPEPIPGARLQGILAHLAIGLRESGLASGQRVLLRGGPSPEALLLALATWMLGAVTVHLSPDTPPEHQRQAFSRVKADWIIARDPRALAELELLDAEAVQRAQLLLLRDAPQKPGARVTSYDALEALGRKKRDLRMNALASQIMAVPRDARAAILYWSDAQELRAAALTQEELLAGLAPLPASWAAQPGQAALLLCSLDERPGLLATLRLALQGYALAFAPTPDALTQVAQAAAPALLVGQGDQLGAALEVVDQQIQSQSLRGTLRKGLGWLERRAQPQADEALDKAVSRVERWLERDLAQELAPALGHKLRLVWSLDPCPEDVRQLLQQAKLRLEQEGSP